MPAARTFDLPSCPPASPRSAELSGTAARAAVVAVIVALAAALLGGEYLATRGLEGYPDSTQQWTD
jgi:hypothetical protein